MPVSVCAAPLPSPPWHAGPLVSPSAWLAGRRAAQGDAPCTVQAQRRRVTPRHPGLQEQPVGAEALEAPGLDQFRQSRRQHGRAPRPHRLTVQPVRQALRAAGRRPSPAQPHSARAILAQALDDSWSAARGLARIPRDPALPLGRRCLQERLGPGPRGWPALARHAGTPLLLRQAATVSPRHAPSSVRARRPLCRFLVPRGARSAARAAALPAVAAGRWATGPQALAPAPVTQLVPRGHHAQPTGQRDAPLGRLRARLGLRPGAGVAMPFDELAGEAGPLLVRGQGGRRDRLPRPPEVGPA